MDVVALSPQEISDRFAIQDLYDRQLAAAEAFDMDVYDTTFAPDATLDLSDFGLAPCHYPEYRDWLLSMKPRFVTAQRVTGGLRLQLDGSNAATHVPVVCYITMRTDADPRLVETGIFYQDKLERRPEGWRIIDRKESLNWSR